MKDAAEIFGVIGLWLLGITATVPGSWPACVVVLAALLAAGSTVFYAKQAIIQRRKGNSHYFVMALITIVLTVVSLGASAIQLKGGGRVLLWGASVCVVVFLIAVYVKNKARP